MPGIFRSAIRRSYGYIRIRSSAERPSGATSTSYSARASVLESRSRMLASSSTTSTRGRALPPPGRGLSSQAPMSRLRKRHWRPTRTAGILPALIRRYTVRRLTCRYARTSSVVRKVSSIMLIRDRQFHGEDGASVRMIGSRDPAAMLLDDSVRQREAQSDPLPNVLRREERLEDAWKRAIAESRAVIPQRHGRPPFFRPIRRRDFDTPRPVGRANRLLCIQHDVEKHLVKEEWVCLDAWQLLIIVSHDFDP